MIRRSFISAVWALAVALATMASLQDAAARSATLADSVAMPAVADSIARLVSAADSALARADSIAERISRAEAATDSIERSIGRALEATDSTIAADKAALIAGKPIAASGKPAREKRDWTTWRPKPQRALWLALVIPGGGQIYNRKYWKLPIIYGGFMGCLYAMNWNNMMYKDYSQAYLDIMDSDPTTQSYNKFLHLGRVIDSSNEERYKQIFKSRKDKYRRWRDLSFFCLLGVYALSVIDAYVDAELSEFDISEDLSLKVEPAVINNSASMKVLEASSFGVQCKLRF